MAHDTFISYANRNQRVAKAVCAHLESEGLPCWIAPRDIPPGKDWGEAITEGIEASQALVLVLSRESDASEEVYREVALADRLRIPIITYRIHDVEPAKRLIRILGTTQWVDTFNRPQKPCLERLVQTIRWVTAGGDPPPPPPPPPPRWRKWALAAAASLVVAAAVVVPLLLAGSKDSDETMTTEAILTTTTIKVPTAVWTELNPGGEQPPARSMPATAYDSQHGRVVMFGGNGEDGTLNDTWIYDSGSNTWTEARPDGEVPSARSAATMVVAQNGLIMFGGTTSGVAAGPYSDEVWRYDVSANTWYKSEPERAWPSARFAPMMVYDWNHRMVIMAGGVGSTQNDTWAYDATVDSWTELHPEGEIPSSREGEAVWDPDSGKMITFGPRGPDSPFQDDTWTFDFGSTTWSWEGLAETTPTCLGSLAFDGGSGKVVMFGGVAYGKLYNETWTYDLATNTWTELEVTGDSPSARKWSKCVYDGSLGEVIMFGGYDTAPLADTWSLRVE